MNENSKFKIKDSVDLFLSNDTYIMAYYMNTRQRKSFKVNEETIHLLEMIDGEKTLADIKEHMQRSFDANPEFVEKVISTMIKNRIVTEVYEHKGDILDETLVKRYTRQINYFAEFLGSEELGLKAQRKVIDARVLIFGCGAIGGNIAIELAMAGVENFDLYDFDEVEISDTARHIYYKQEYEGRKKVEALASEIKKINARAKINIINQSMKPDTDVEGVIKHTDFVINTMDEPYIGYTASKISRICVKYRI